MDSVGKARLGICFLLALMVGGATVVLPTPALASERAMRVDTVPAPAGISVSSAGTGLVAKFAQLEVAPFDMVGASWEGREAGEARVRARSGGRWGPWTELEVEDEDAPDPGSQENRNPRTVTRPLWAENSDGFELEGPSAGLKVHLVRQDGARVRVRSAPGAGAAERPPIGDRGSWGARGPKGPASYAPNVKMAFVHHTAGSNAYGADDVPRILRSDQAYHMDVRGWNDIGYNFLVDRFGRIWEGRAGGTDNAVIGAHAEGYNTGSTGVAVLGTFTSAEVPGAAVNAVSRLLGWKLAIHGVDPEGRNGEFHNVAGHRDSKATDCPGARLYDRLPEIRSAARSHAAPAPPLLGLLGPPPPQSQRAAPPPPQSPPPRAAACRRGRGRKARCAPARRAKAPKKARAKSRAGTKPKTATRNRKTGRQR